MSSYFMLICNRGLNKCLWKLLHVLLKYVAWSPHVLTSLCNRQFDYNKFRIKINTRCLCLLVWKRIKDKRVMISEEHLFFFVFFLWTSYKISSGTTYADGVFVNEVVGVQAGLTDKLLAQNNSYLAVNGQSNVLIHMSWYLYDYYLNSTYHTVKRRNVKWIRPVMCSKWF